MAYIAESTFNVTDYILAPKSPKVQNRSENVKTTVSIGGRQETSVMGNVRVCRFVGVH